MIDEVANLENAMVTYFAGQERPTSSEIRELIEKHRQVPIYAVSDEEAERVARLLEQRFGVSQTIGPVIVDTRQDHQPWLDAAKIKIYPYYWDRYRRYLSTQMKLPPQVLTTLDDVTDRILNLLEDPSKEGPWDRRGMVVGHVQSGKTANYTGLICKAADAGYKLIVVIAGIHNNLRSQTQRRIDEGFVGRDSSLILNKQPDRFVGVGTFDQQRRPSTLTNTVRDFNKNQATSLGIPIQNLTEPVVLVIKKNSSTLGNLIEWLKEHNTTVSVSTIDQPMLLIDDEADNASININRGPGEVSRINGQIRELLELFRRSCYVGYTATPFANIFIDPDTEDEMRGEDLFPRSFIVSLDPPSNYFGASTVFGAESEQFVRIIDDNEDILPMKHPQGFTLAGIPESLVDAIRTFIVGRAIRIARGHIGQHTSMLVNASRLNGVQRQLRDEIHAILTVIQEAVRVKGALTPDQALKDLQIRNLRKVWESEFATAEFDWDTIQYRLHEAAAPISVVEINSQSGHSLNYSDHRQNGLHVIAVGGYALSRGLTLEGLMVSYFLRNSMMYDTLMQMGRWFGYRLGYDDLCRIWMPEEAHGWYEHIAESIEELRDEFRRMEAVNATPEEFGLKVRSHPTSLIVTARNKMGSGRRQVVSVGLSGRLIETHALRRDEESLEVNRRAAQTLARQLKLSEVDADKAKEVPYGYLLKGVPVAPVLDFLTEFHGHQGTQLTDGDPVRRYISERAEDELKKWDVLFASLEQGGEITDTSLGIPIRCQQRSQGKRSDSNTLLVSNRQRVSSRGIEKAGLTSEQRKFAEEKHREQLNAEGKLTEGYRIHFPDRIYREVRERPLLMIHLLEIKGQNPSTETSQPVVAWGISFPRTRRPEDRVEYVVNSILMRELYEVEDNDDDAVGDDN